MAVTKNLVNIGDAQVTGDLIIGGKIVKTDGGLNQALMADGSVKNVRNTQNPPWFDAIPYIKNDGVMEVGKYIDFHASNTETTDNDFCYHSVMKLMGECTNLWCDITWEALDYFSNNPFKLMNMDKSRLILGTDMNKLSISRENYEKEWNKIHNLDSIINSDRNIKKLFKYENIYRLKK